MSSAPAVPSRRRPKRCRYRSHRQDSAAASRIQEREVTDKRPDQVGRRHISVGHWLVPRASWPRMATVISPIQLDGDFTSRPEERLHGPDLRLRLGGANTPSAFRPLGRPILSGDHRRRSGLPLWLSGSTIGPPAQGTMGVYQPMEGDDGHGTRRFVRISPVRPVGTGNSRERSALLSHGACHHIRHAAAERHARNVHAGGIHAPVHREV
jgi:hypothetical protein